MPNHTHQAPAHPGSDFALAREISPRRKSTEASDVPGLVHEQLAHFGIDPASDFGRHLAGVTEHLYAGHADLKRMWEAGVSELASLNRREKIERFAAQKFMCFQLAKMLDTLQHPFRKTYQSLVESPTQRLAKGAYPIFDNVTAIFSSRPVIARTATYIYACAEWVDDAFQGKELMHEVYSRLLNPTNITLANHIVDVEAGALAHEYFAWNFNSGMAAVDAMLSHLLGHRDIVLASRNVYGGTYQLMHDWFAKKSNLDVSVNFFDGYSAEDFQRALDKVTAANKDRLAEGRHIYVYIESPCNPHGYVLDVPAIAKLAHGKGLTVICDSTVGTPFLHRPLQRADAMERPDFVIHSYTKDLSGHGSTTAGVIIGRNERMFIPKHESAVGPGPDGKPRTWAWDETLFWNVYYVKGAFLDADKAFEVLTGMHTLELRVLRKAVNTLTLAEILAAHPDINVHCNAAPGNVNAPFREKCLYLGLPAALFTIDFEGKAASNGGAAVAPFHRETFKRFFDCLEPTFGHQVSLGQPNTVVLCPAITSHSEMSEQSLRDAGIQPTTVRIAVGLEDPRTLVAHLVNAAKITLDHDRPGFSARFPSPEQIDAIYRKHFSSVHARYVEAMPTCASLMS
ncbi:MAG: aminotransferase class I/II-fold pyridoxal phosphate-dependent enzyme [Planctomycetota bacterium]|nr:aminotransferase class I/II-fold pyridoxal phosphate-dependent enzyme [Planctomycetota bacterium]